MYVPNSIYKDQKENLFMKSFNKMLKIHDYYFVASKIHQIEIEIFRILYLWWWEEFLESRYTNIKNIYALLFKSVWALQYTRTIQITCVVLVGFAQTKKNRNNRQRRRTENVCKKFFSVYFSSNIEIVCFECVERYSKWT